MSKYRAIRTNGYASKLEAKRAWELKILSQAGDISNLREQVTFEILPKCKGYSRPLRYVADFVFTEKGQEIVADAKGFRTPAYKIKKRLLWQLHGIEIREI